MEEPLVVRRRNNIQQSNDSSVTKTFSHLPVLRYTSFATLLVAVDSLLSISLWIAGGSSKYLEDSVEEFSFYHSTFDLACIAAIRGIILIGCMYYIEYYTLAQYSTKYKERQFSSRRLSCFIQVTYFVITLVTFCYSLIKGILIILQGEEAYNQLHITYKILCFVGVITPLIEIVIGIGGIYFMRRLIHVHKLRLILNETDDKPYQKKADLLRIIKLAKPEYPIIAFGILMLVISNAAQAVTPYFFGYIIDLATKNQTLCQEIADGKINATGPVPHCSLWLMSRAVLILFGMTTGSSIAAMARNFSFTLAGERFVARIRKRLFATIMEQEMGFFDMNRTGELINRLASDTTVIQTAVTENISIMFRYFLQLVVSVGIMFWINAKLTAVLLSVVPILIIGAVYYGRQLKQLKKRYQDSLAKASSTAEETISNMRTVRSFSNEHKMITHYDKDINASYKIGRFVAVLSAGFILVVFSLVYLACCLILWYGGYLVYQGEITAGLLTSLMFYTLTLAMCFAFISSVYGEFMQAVGASIRVFELMDRIPEIENGTLRNSSFKGDIEFRNVRFSYPSRANEVVLQSININVKPGEVVALVGPSGGGKSTIVNLIEHFYDISDGEILLGGINVKYLDPKWFRKYIGIVNQEPVLFAASIKENISFGKDDATQAEIEEAARQANAHDFITSFGDGYDTLVGERGVRLSGGQKQRIAIARALLLNPDILLLDEATSALDAESEHLVQEAIDHAMQGRTVLVIAHRLSTVQNASKVIVINKGCIAEEGTHDELLALDGVYKKLILRQLTSNRKEKNN